MTETIPINYDDTTKNDELRGLVEVWRDIADERPMDTDHDRALRYAADELEAVIDDE